MKSHKIFNPLTINFVNLRFMKVLFVVTLISVPVLLSGQEAEAFKPGGKPEARVFSSLTTTFSDGANHTKFDLTRAYLGYSYNFSKKLSGRVVYDVADPSVGKLKFTGLLKFAYLKFQTGKWTVSGGMIPLPEYDLGDKKWGHRYVYKTSHDDYGFGFAADLGVNVTYNITSWISADITVMNGEGYKLTEADSTFKAAFGITLTPAEKFLLRGYFDNMSKDGVHQQTVEIIAGYETKGSGLFAAYNFRKDHSLVNGHDYHGVSLFGTLAINEKIRIFGRYDYTGSAKAGNEPDPWNLAKDGQLFLTGIEFVLAPGVNISPNFQGWNPADPQLPFISRIALSMDLKF